MEIVSINDLAKDDVILMENGDGTYAIAAVESTETEDEYLIIPANMGGLDYSPENPDEIVRLKRGSSNYPLLLTIYDDNTAVRLFKPK